ncbi:RIP metalloprotease RseP [Patescibacteria group bacterium]
MNLIITIIAVIIVFSILILIHELGHYVMARRAGIKVEEFGFGLPPRLWGKKAKNGTIFSINWIPFGGFVKMLGEDSSDPKMLRSKKSFIGKSIRDRVLVIVAGVFMNFLLAWFLLTIGFTAGMEPLLAPDDVLPAVDEGLIVLEEGLKIQDVKEGSLAEEMGFEEGDLIYTVDEQVINDHLVLNIAEDYVHNYKVIRDGEIYSYELFEEDVEGMAEDERFGLSFYAFASFPRVKLFSVNEDGDAYRYGLREGDVILEANDKEVFNVQHFEDLVRGVPIVEYLVYRDGLLEEVIVEHEKSRRVIVSRVLPDSPAEEAGFKDGDVIASINGKLMSDSEELIAFVEENAEEEKGLSYLVERGDQQYVIEVVPEEGKIGVMLSELMTYGANDDLTVYNISVLSSVVEIKDQKYPIHVSPFKAIDETIRLSKLTVVMIGDFVGGLISNGDIPDTVAGPVGIAQLTFGFVQQGLIPLIRFIAILSLSLAVLNILPFPALDGGRLLFIVIELIIGRRVNQKWEALVHAFGFVLILALFVAITYGDILRILS